MKPLHLETLDRCTIVTIEQSILIDQVMIDELGKQLFQAAEESGYRLIVDFVNVERVSSAVLGKLVAVRRRILNAKGRLTLCNCGNALTEAIDVLSMRRLFDICVSRAEAIEYMEHDAVSWKAGAER